MKPYYVIVSAIILMISGIVPAGAYWEREMPFDEGGHTLRVIWGWQDMVVAGGDSTLVIKKGSKFNVFHTPVRVTIRDIWGTSDTNVYAVTGSDHIYHWNGSMWHDMYVPAAQGVSSVWGAGAHCVYFAGYAVLYRWDGHEWTILPGPDAFFIYAVWGVDCDNLYVTGECLDQYCGEHLMHWNGSSWTAVSPIHGWDDTWFTDITGTGPDDIYIGGKSYCDVSGITTSELYHWNGREWAYLTTQYYSPDNPIFCLPGHGLYVTDSESIARLADGEWTVLDVPWSACHGIWGSAPDNLYGAGDFSQLFHWDGTFWATKCRQPGTHFNAVWSDGSAMVMAGADGANAAFDRGIWSQNEPDWDMQIECLYGFDPGCIFGGGNGLYVWNGSEWRTLVRDNGIEMRDLWGVSPDFLIGVGHEYELFVWDGTDLTTVTVPELNLNNYSIWGTAWNDIFIGALGKIVHFDGSRFEVTELYRRQVNAIWGRSGTDVYACGWHLDGGGFIQHFDGSEWTELYLFTRTEVQPFEALVEAPDGRMMFLTSDDVMMEMAPGVLVSTMQNPGFTLTDMVRAGDDIAVTGDGGNVLRYHGLEQQVFIRANDTSLWQYRNRASVWFENPSEQTLEQVPFVFLLEFCGVYYAWPDWQAVDPASIVDGMLQYVRVPPGITELPVIQDLDMGPDSIATPPLHIYAAMLAPDGSRVIGRMAEFQWYNW